MTSLPYTLDHEEDREASALAIREAAAKVLLSTVLSRAILSIKTVGIGIDGTATAARIRKIAELLQDAGETR